MEAQQSFIPFYHQVALGCVFHVLSLHSSADGGLDCVLLLAIVNKVASNIVHTFLCGYMFSFPWV